MPDPADVISFVDIDSVRDWLARAPFLSQFTRSIGAKTTSDAYAEEVLRVPLHVRFVIGKLLSEPVSAAARAEHAGDLPADALDSIPFYSLCRGLFLPLSSMTAERAAFLFGIKVPDPPGTADREKLLTAFLEKDCGLDFVQKLGCILGDPFRGRRSTIQRESILRLLRGFSMMGRREMLDRLTQVGDVAVLAAELRPTLRAEPTLTASEVLETLRFLPDERLTFKFELMHSLLARMGKLEAYFFAKLLQRKAGFGFDYQGPLLARVLGEHFNAPPEQVGHAMALTDAFNVVSVLERDGVDGLRKIQLQPLVPLRPALASGTTDEIKRFPVWVERKYDGIRLMLHKSTDTRGSVLTAAYTRGRGDWLELIPGLLGTIRMVPGRSFIIDGELYGTVLRPDGARPATVYEVYANLQGEKTAPVNLRFAAFDLLYLNGKDVTAHPLSQRRELLQRVLGPLANSQMPLPIPLVVADGQLAQSRDDVKRLYQHFRAQGYEGVIAKDLEGPYLLAQRDPSWLKRKPEITLDLVLLGAVLAVTSKEKVGMFGSYVIGAKAKDGSFVDVGDVAGLDRVRDAELQTIIMREGLLTGRRIERQSASGTRPGFELRPHVVVTVRFEGIVKDALAQTSALRDPKLIMLRPDKNPMECNTTEDIEELWLRQRMG